MNTGSKIRGNTTSSYGGGVYVNGIFTMEGGEISGNTSSYDGGGVYVSSTSAFTKQSGGTIYGSDAIDALKNTAASGNGHAVYVFDGRKRNTTAGSGLALNSALVVGGWETELTFDADGGSPATQTRSVESGGTVGSSNMPSEPTKSGYTFGGWYTERDGGGSQFTASTQANGNITVYARWKQAGASVEITLQPQPGNPSLSSKSIFVDEQAEFSAGTGYKSWKWYWNGEEIRGAASGIYTLPAYSKSAGIHELSVMVIAEDGVKLSARCRVTIKAK